MDGINATNKNSGINTTLDRYGNGGGGTSDYTDLKNKPSINGLELSGNKTSNELGVYSKPNGGIPESDLSPDVQQALKKHFKGWLESTADLPANPVVGDYAYVKDNGTTYIYRCSTNGEWPSTSTEEKDPVDVTFAGGQEVNETYIDNTHLVNPKDGALPMAADVMQLKAKLEGVTAEETKVTNYTLQAGVLNANTKEFVGTSGAAKYTVIPVGEAKRVRFLGVSYGDANTSYNYGFGFYNSSDEIFGTQKYEGRNDSGSILTKEYVVDIPDGAVSLICSVILASGTINESNFYCYLRTGNVPKIINNLTTGGVDDVLSAEQGKVLEEGKINKVDTTVIEAFSEIVPSVVQEGCTLNSNGGRSSTDIEGCAVIQIEVTPGQKYYISGSTGTASTAILACYVKNLSKWSGSAASILVEEGVYVEQGSNINETRLETTAPEGAVGLRINQYYTRTRAKCEIKTSTTNYVSNENIIKSVGDVNELETEEKETIVGAINALNDTINSVKNQKKHLKVLLIGSSHGVNTISMFPVLAYHAGIDIVCGNLYRGSATLGLYSTRPAVQIPYMADNDVSFERFAVFENGEWTTETTKTISYALGLKEWDVIILQRGASEDYWNEDIANFYQHLLDYIKDNCSYNPRIYFNSGIADAARDITNCLEQTNTLMTTAFQQKSQFGIDVIPTAVAVQYARETCLKETGQDLGSSNYYKCMACDAQHLDTGIGQYVTGCTVFEKIVGDFFNTSVRELAYLPVYSDVSGNVINSGSEYFTPITEYYSRIAKTCAALAVIDEKYNAETAAYLSTKYGNLPSTYTVTANLTGCSLNNEALSVSNDDVYMARLTLDSGMTSVSVVVTVGGEDVTTSVYATYDGYYAIRIGDITGNIVITASASAS